MAKLKLGAIADDKPVKLTVEFPALVHRDLLAYAEVLARETGQPIPDPLNWLRRCWRGSWQRTVFRKGRGAGIKLQVRDSAPPKSSENLPVPDCHCRPSNVPRSRPGSGPSRRGARDRSDQRSSADIRLVTRLTPNPTRREALNDAATDIVAIDSRSVSGETSFDIRRSSNSRPGSN